MNYTDIFVYGTLRRGFHNHKLLSTSEYLGTAKTVEKFTMFSRGIPFVSRSKKLCQITGELYRVSDSVLSSVDSLESYYPDSPESSWYQRQEIDLITSDGSQKRAYIYFNDNEKGRIITSGDFALNS